MSLVTLDLNPRVRDIIKAAIKAAQPLWLGMSYGGKEILERRALWMIEIAPDHFQNGNRVEWQAERNDSIDGAVLAMTRNGAPFTGGPLLVPRHMLIYDTLLVTERAVTLWGKIPWQD